MAYLATYQITTIPELKPDHASLPRHLWALEPPQAGEFPWKLLKADHQIMVDQSGIRPVFQVATVATWEQMLPEESTRS